MAMKKTHVQQDPLLEEIASVKRLLVLFLMKTGASQDEIALALKVDRSVISRMIPSSKIKKYDNES
jgi:transcriptional regulator